MAITTTRAAIEAALRDAEEAKDEEAIAAAKRLLALMDETGVDHVTA